MPKNVPDRKSGGNSGLDSKVSVFGYFFICLNMLFFGWLISADRNVFFTLTEEDHWVENLTAVWFFLASLLFFTTAGTERDVFRRTIYILGGIALLFVAGEEISWGQRIVGFSTPDFLVDLNIQKEFNLHNMQGIHNLLELTRYGSLIFAFLTCIAFFCDKKFLFGIPVPSVLLALGAMVTIRPDTLDGGILLILLFVIYAFISRHTELIMASISAVALALTVSYVNTSFDWLSQNHRELDEYLIGIVCILLSIELTLAQGSIQRKITMLFNGLKLLPYHLFSRQTETGQKKPLPPDSPPPPPPPQVRRLLPTGLADGVLYRIYM